MNDRSLKRLKKFEERRDLLNNRGERITILRRRFHKGAPGSHHITDAELKFWEELTRPLEGQELGVFEIEQMLTHYERERMYW